MLLIIFVFCVVTCNITDILFFWLFLEQDNKMGLEKCGLNTWCNNNNNNNINYDDKNSEQSSSLSSIIITIIINIIIITIIITTHEEAQGQPQALALQLQRHPRVSSSLPSGLFSRAKEARRVRKLFKDRFNCNILRNLSVLGASRAS